MKYLKTDKELHKLIKEEIKRQQTTLELIPSENIVSKAVLEALGSELTNKYSEGYPGARYYGGNEIIDKIETLAQQRAKQLFKVEHVNVQPYSGSPANFAVYNAICNPGDVAMGQALPEGGHLTHGWKASATSKFFSTILYGLNKKGEIDLEQVEKLAKKHKPKLIWVGSTAYPKKLPFKEFARIADQVGAYLVADISHIAGLIVGGAHPSPVNYVHIITTTTHKTLRGPRGAMIMVTKKGIKKDKDLPSKIDKSVFPGLQGGPHNHQTAAIAVALKEASTKKFANYAKQVVKNAKTLAKTLKQNKVNVISGGTQNHLLLVDVGYGKGAVAEYALELVGLTVNKNTIPNEPSNPFYPSGIRLGTPSVTTRKMKEKQMIQIAQIIAETLNEIKDIQIRKNNKKEDIKKAKKQVKANKKIKSLRKEVEKLAKKFPIPEKF